MLGRNESEGIEPEIIIVSEADTVHFVEGNMLSAAIGKGVSTLAGSKTMARQQMDSCLLVFVLIETVIKL